jgi:hypothetical protein
MSKSPTFSFTFGLLKPRINSFLAMCATFPDNLVLSDLIISIIHCEVQES